MVKPWPVRCLTCTPATVTEQVISWPMLTTVTLAGCLAEVDRLTCLVQGNATLNSVWIMSPASMYMTLIARPSPLTVYTTVCIAPGVFGTPGGVVVPGGAVVVVRGGRRVVEGGDVVRVVGGATVVLGTGGSGSIAVCCLSDPLAMTSATTKPITSNTAAPAKNHNHRGERGGPSVGPSSFGGPPCCQYCGGNCWVGLGW